MEITQILKPETVLEHFLLKQPEVIEGLLWGEPRYGHPEGKVLYHIPEIFRNIDALCPPLSTTDREKLRIITLLHDTFKYAEDKSRPRDWSKHHSILARRFAEKHITDPVILDIIEFHDEAYHCWRIEKLEYDPEAAAERMRHLFKNVGHCLQLYYTFFKCDTRTGDKTQKPVKWFEDRVKGIEIISFNTLK